MKWYRMTLIVFSMLFVIAGSSFSFGDINDQLVLAANEGKLAKAQSLLSQGADVNMESPLLKTTALMSAVIMNHPDIVQVLLEHGADANTKTSNGLTALTMAALGHTEIVKLLLSHGADMNAKDAMMGDTALIAAAQSGHLDSVQILFEHGADVNARDNAGMTALTIATMRGQDDVAEFLRAHGAVAKGLPVPPTTGNVLTQQGSPQVLPQYASDVDTPTYKSTENPNNYAVVIGVEKYGNLPSAQFASRDAQAVRVHLVALGYPMRNIFFLSDQDATRAKISQSVNTWLPNRVSENSTVFFYYSGHGAPDTKTNQAYLVGMDGDPEDLESTAYPVTTLYAKLGGLKARQVIVALDSCFSGAGGRSVLPKGARPLVSKIDMGAVPKKLVVLAASDKDQISGTVDEQGHGAFTYYLLKGLAGAARNDSGGVTVRSLYSYMVPKVQDAARLHNRDQTPQLMPADSEQAGISLR